MNYAITFLLIAYINRKEKKSKERHYMNRNKIYTCIGASNHSKQERVNLDYYATDPKAVRLLLELESFNPHIWEPCCGEGHISKALEEAGYQVRSTDIINRGYCNQIHTEDFLKTTKKDLAMDIITNPPYKNAKEFAEQALKVIKKGNKVAMFLKLTFLEGKSRKEFFKQQPPKRIYVSSSRLSCARNGEFEKYPMSAVAYAWFIWEKGYTGEPVIKWFN